MSENEQLTVPTAEIAKKVTQWEINTIGNFLLELYHEQLITPQKNWEIEKRTLREEFCKRVLAPPLGNSILEKLQEACGTKDMHKILGTSLYRCNFLLNTPRGSLNFRIKNIPFLEFRRKKRMQYDERQINGSYDPFTNDNFSEDNDNFKLESIIEEHTIDDHSECLYLEYKKSQTQMCFHGFGLTSMGCYICQKNFDDIEEYEEHIEYHGDESDFKYLETMVKLSSPMLKLSYQLCLNSHYFCFTLSTELDDIVIDKIIIVQSRSFCFVNNSRLPCDMPKTRKYQFFVDSHIFTIYQEQPIVVIFKNKQSQINTRNIEQHHFMRTEAFPVVNMALKPYRLSSAPTFKAKYALENYPIKGKKIKNDFPNAETDLLSKQLASINSSNITDIMTKLLQIEDLELTKAYIGMTQTNVQLHQFGRDLSLQLKPVNSGVLYENILSPFDDVLIIAKQTDGNCDEQNISELIFSDGTTDEIVKKYKKTQKKMYYGRVECVSNRRVTFQCDFKIPDSFYTVIFRPSRLVLRYQYRALNWLKTIGADVLNRFLFPDNIVNIDSALISAMSNLNLNDLNILHNPEQMQAVRYIADSNRLPAPYIVLGPPGTGKTATIVESIFQLYKRRSNTRMLIMAGSNSACDEIGLRLLRALQPINERNIIARIFSRANDKRIDNIDELLLDYSNMYTTHFYPHVNTLHEYRIVICTLSVAGKLATGKFGKDEDGAPVFTHVFVDEAAASTETEVIMGVVCAMSPQACLILSGDHKQLGPVLKSKRAKELGLDVSLMERLLKRKCYEVDEFGNYNRDLQTRLKRNYRSHPEIVKMYSDMYYDSELIAMAPKESVNLGEKWHFSTNPDFPILFHCVFGTSYSNANSSSLSNQSEIEAVMEYVKDLIYFGINGKKITQKDIGIISPYKNQYTRIQEQLNLRNWLQIECGSVETFQGKEKDIIIVSFVRSFLSSLGFLDDPRRLNVTLSRPKSLLILIGNPRTLDKSDDFRRIIEICKSRNTLVGAKYYDNENDNDLKKRNKENNPNAQSNSKKKYYQQRKNQWKPQQNAATISNNNNAKKIDTEGGAKLGKSLKKSTNPLTQLPRQRIENYKKLINPNDVLNQNQQQKAAEQTLLDKIFDDLPRVPRDLDSDVDTDTDAATAYHIAQYKKYENILAKANAVKLPTDSTNLSSRPIPAASTTNVGKQQQQQHQQANSIRQIPAATRMNVAQQKPLQTTPISEINRTVPVNAGRYQYATSATSTRLSQAYIPIHEPHYVNSSYHYYTPGSTEKQHTKQKKSCVIQ